MTDGAPLILELLTYIEQVEKLKAKPAFTVPTEYFAAYQHELKGLPEIRFNLQAENDDIWLRIPRLHEVPPPELDEKLSPWVTLSKSPAKNPELKAQIAISEGTHQVVTAELQDAPQIQELFDAYIEKSWRPWASAEVPRRKTISRYNQLFSLQQAIASDGADTPLELIWGIGVAAWRKEGFATSLRHPLIGQACEISLNEATFDLEVRPRDIEPRLETDTYTEMGLPGVRPLEAFWKSTLTNGAHRVNPFEASTFDGVLKAAVGHLDPGGAYEVLNDDVVPPGPRDKLKVTNTWVVYARKRSNGIFLEDIKRLKKNIESATSLPSVIRSFVEHGATDLRVQTEQAFRGLSSSDSPSDAFELYFPMPYNEEQVSIVRKLEHGNGVVVQGPPGTGKTHTIANIICHYLAQGKRVLVTSKGESALTEVLGKLPESIRPLSVALLSDERDGMKQFEHSIQTIASSVASMNPTRAAADIAALEEKLNQLHARISYVDHSVNDFASKHMRNYTFQGKEVSPEEIAKLILSQADEHNWFDDDLPVNDFESNLPFDETAISCLRQARVKVGTRLSYLGSSLPMADEFPAWSNLRELHRDLVRARAIEADLSQGTILQLSDSTFETFEEAKALVAFLDQRQALSRKLSQSPEPLLEFVATHLGNMRPDDLLLTSLLQSCNDIQELEDRRHYLLTKAVDVPDDAELNPEFKEAIARLVAGKSAFGLPFGKADARKLVAAVTVLSSAPKFVEEWKLVHETLDWRAKARQCVARWNSVVSAFGVEPQSGGVEASFRILVRLQRRIKEIHDLAFNFDGQLHDKFDRVFGKVTAGRMWDGGEVFIFTAKESLQVHVDKGRLAYAMKRVGELVRKLHNHHGAVVDDLRAFLTESFGGASSDEPALERSWLALQTELSHLSSLRPALDEIALASDLIESAGATKWAERLRTQPAGAENDPLVPSAWREAWNWRCAVMFLERIDGHHKMRELLAQRKTLTTTLARTYQELVAEKTWLGVFRNSPDHIRQALQAYLNAIQAMGAGTGVRAIRYRKNAREAMTRAYRAVPCWILPEWRISETIPAEMGLFDLVVIDEASQSDIWALPALLRGKQLLVVGDHKQVSPSAIGVPEEKIKELSNRFLANQVHGSEMTPDKSIYDLARVVFAGNSVMLKEHFRCVPAIIEFSNREFYQGDIKPLRLPHANERLDPPLIDVFVRGGFRNGDVNDAEAKAIVDEIEVIIADKDLAGRSIGVVTLLGSAQSACIHELVSNRISPVDVVARKIAVGPPPVFQGKERDIMLLSMVLGPGDRSAQNRPDQYQRFNVALSRARDRMYLFRSVEQTAFAKDTLNGKLIHHFKNPFRQDAHSTRVMRERCESGFELDMFDELVKRGFRVEPQVKCGSYRIDFVVEGREGRRLAVECDGDRFHGPGQWSDDMARQRVLERAGWTFWRCFASSFTLRRDQVVNDLLQTLGRLGIEPLGAEFVDNTVWTHSREVDPYGVSEEVENSATPPAHEPPESPDLPESAVPDSEPHTAAGSIATENERSGW
jgi:very-short-patch-repair endonuclease